MAEQQPRIIKPPKHLGDKVPRTGGPTPAQAIGRALKLADDLIDSYQGWAVDDLQKLWQAFGNGNADASAVREMFSAAHEIRGQGGSFGFPLITVVADSLCKFLEPRGFLESKDLDIVRVHILALKAVFAQELKGPQAQLTEELGPLLALLRDKA